MDETTLMLDSATIKARQYAGGVQKGRSWGGLTAKVQAVTDRLGNPLRFPLSGRNCNDICMARTLLESFDLTGKLIIAGKGYDSEKFVRWVEKRGGIAVIPGRITAKSPRNTDWYAYKERHLIEKLFLKLKNHCRLMLEKSLFLSCRYGYCLHSHLVALIVL